MALLPMKHTDTISPTIARRLVIMRQHLAGRRAPANSEGMMDVMRDIRYLQLDPMRIVAPSHTLVLWSRLGPYDISLLDKLLWKERRLFEDWAQATSIVLTEDYPIFEALKLGFAAGDTSWALKIRKWMNENKRFSTYILKELSHKGPLPSKQIEDRAVVDWSSSGWTSGRNADMMLFFLKAQGKIMVAGRVGNQKLWDLTEHFLPEWVPMEKLSEHEVAYRATQISLRALGVARAEHIKRHYIRGCYHGLDKVLAELEAEKSIFRVEIRDEGKSLPGPWFVHVNDLPLLHRLEAGEWTPRTTLLSPFDNLICDRQRTEQVFNFSFRFEVYVPKSKRKFGCYVMPILHGDHFIGRLDPVVDRKNSRLIINAIHTESDALESELTSQAIVKAVEELSVFLGAKEIACGSCVSESWRRMFHIER